MFRCNDVEKIRSRYLKGQRVSLIQMKGESQMKKGLEGTIEMVDDFGQIHVNWDNGSSLALILNEDSFVLI